MRYIKLKIDGEYSEEEIIKYFSELGFKFVTEKNLMTREEAIKKIKNKICDTEFENLDYLLLAKLEALGLIKFKEEKKKEECVSMLIDEVHPFYAPVKIKDAIEALNKAGYTVRENG